MNDAKRERVIKWLQDLMTEAARLVTELESEDRPKPWTPVQELPQDLAALVKTAVKIQGVWHVKTQYCSKDNFTLLAAAFRAMNGKYVSAGRDSEFLVPDKKVT